MLVGMLKEQNRSDLAKLMHWPEMEQYQRIISFKFNMECLSFWKRKIESSAKRRCVKETPLLPIVIPLIFLWVLAWVRAMDRMLVQNKNIYREIGSPCLNPLEGWNGWVGLPLSKIAYWAEVIHSMIQLIQVPLKFIETAFGKFQLTLSLDLHISIWWSTRSLQDNWRWWYEDQSYWRKAP